MNQRDDYLLEIVWSDRTETLKNEIIDFWLMHRALPGRENAEKRFHQVFCIGRDGGAGQIVGLGTIYEKYNRRLENHFFHYRSFVAPDHRRSHLGIRLLLRTRDVLEAAFINREQTRCIGMILDVENEYLQKHRNQAVWPQTRFIYIGKTERGAHQRVYFFEGALIS